ncbi:MAG: hypothetical protein JKY37_26930 [Nannocystaceae bacterium]|nr:hypothetical protein [Nannocystaceae bacterium]
MTEASQIPKATLIPMTAQTGEETALCAFLKSGRDLVARDEPDTVYWYALQQEGSAREIAIFDLFTGQAGREAHFNGGVAAALADKAAALVQGGWDSGVVANVEHFNTLAAKLPQSKVALTKATRIALQAVPGQADALAKFLKQGCDLVIEGEPLTLVWLALQSEADDHRFAIIDLFADQEGRDTHFAGAVATALKQNAEALVVGGWSDGVLSNVAHYDVVAAK